MCWSYQKAPFDYQTGRIKRSRCGVVRQNDKRNEKKQDQRFDDCLRESRR
jgi:hypothetical protein